jgi:hypothetical protein
MSDQQRQSSSLILKYKNIENTFFAFPSPEVLTVFVGELIILDEVTISKEFVILLSTVSWEIYC